jgi:hypothetical protein
MLTNAKYTSRGFEVKRSFQFTEEELKDQAKKWILEKWPIEFLYRDHYGLILFVFIFLIFFFFFFFFFFFVHFNRRQSVV